MKTKFRLKFQSQKVAIKNILEKIKNTPACHSERISQQTEKSKNPVLNITSRITKGSFISFRMTKQAVKIFLTDHIQLLIKSSAENHLRIQKCKKIKSGDICNLEFDSYSQLKKYQKKVRILTFSTSSVFSFALIAIISVQVFLSSTSQGATFQFQQTNWSTESANTAVHPGDKTGWNKYESKDASISVVNGGADVQLSAVNSSTTQNDFSVGTQNNVSAAVNLALNKTYTYNVAPLAPYDDVGNAQLTNGIIREQLYSGVEATVGWRYGNNNNPIVIIDLGSTQGVSAVKSYIGGGQGDNEVVAPTQVDVSTSLDNVNFSAVTTLTGVTNIEQWLTINISPITARYVKIKFYSAPVERFVMIGEIQIISAGVQLQKTETAGAWATMAPMPDTSATGSFAYDSNGNIYASQGQSSAGGYVDTFWKYNIASNTWSAMAPMPGATAKGSLTYGNDGNFYAISGGGSVSFWKYNIASNTWSEMASLPAASNFGSSSAYGGDGNIYASQGFGGGDYTNVFWKYNIALNTWSTIAPMPAKSGNNSLIFDSNGNIYANQGQTSGGTYSSLFWKYNIGADAWSTIASLPGLSGNGSFAFDGNGNIYANQGQTDSGTYSSSFWKYNIGADAWSTVASLPGLSGNGSFAFDGTGNIYANQGMSDSSNTRTSVFWKYSIYDNYASPGNFESVTIDMGGKSNLSSINFNPTTTPATDGTMQFQLATSDSTDGPWTYLGPDGTASTYFTTSGQVTHANLNGHRYVRYKTFLTGAGSGWSTMASAPAGTWGAPVYDGNGNMYVLQTNSATGFWRYNIASNVWSVLANTPAGTNGDGGRLAYDNNGNIFGTRGMNTADFWKYNIATNVWTTMTSTPEALHTGGMITYDDNGHMYMFRGYSYTTWSVTPYFWRYDIATNTWSSLANAPGGVLVGELTYDGNGNIFGAPGNSLSFWKYNIATNTWSAMADTLGAGSSGASLVYDNNGNIFRMQANRQFGFWKYNIASNAWTVLPRAPYEAYYGGIAYDGNGNIFGFMGWNMATFWKFSTRTNATPTFSDITLNYSSYPASQTLTSSKYDTTSFANIIPKIQWSENLPTGTDLGFQIRTSPDNVTWTDFMGPDGTSATKFTEPSGSETIPIGAGKIGSGGDDQWMQYKTFLTSDGISTPTLSDTNITYVVNATPELQNIVSAQDDAGIVTTTFEVRDPDTTTGLTNGTVLGGLEYCTDNTGVCADSGDWISANTLIYKNEAGNVLPDNTLDIEETNFTPYQITWTPKTDYNNEYITNLKMRVSANDSEAANNIGYGISNAFTLDTKNPTPPAFTIDHTQNQLSINAPIDDSNYEIYIGNISATLFESSNLTSPLLNKSDTYPKTYTYANMTQDPATVYVGIKDEKGNIAYSQTTTPAKPTNIVYYDTSNSATNEFREFIAWDILSPLQVGAGFSSYKVYRSTDNENFTLVGTIQDRETNYLLQTDLTQIRYYYKLVAEDINGNKSAFSQKVDDIPDGQGGTDQTPPTISSVDVTNIETTSAVIHWTTDELSNSSVGYSTQVACEANTDPEPPELPGCQYLPERGMASMNLEHEIVLTGLIPGTEYNVRVKSYDLIGNLAQNDKDNNGASLISKFTFSTLPGPAISAVTIPNVSNTQATINWKTTTDSSSYVVYSDTISNGLLSDSNEFGTPDLVGNPINGKYAHSQTITTFKDGEEDLPLVPDTVYYFYVKSVDADENISIDNNGGNFYELRTTEDNNPPVISNVTTPIISHNSVAINWITDEPATSKVSYKKDTESSYSDSEEVLIYDRSHYIILSTLEPDTRYDFKVTSKDINTNLTAVDQKEFTTAKNLEFQHEPLSKIENVLVPDSNKADKTALITFTTDQLALCYTELDTISATGVTSTTKFENGYLTDINYNTSHAIALTELSPLTKYSFTISCHDNLIIEGKEDEEKKTDKFANWADSEITEFTTTEERYTAAGAGALGDKDAPVINNVKVASIDGESATVTWDTDEIANSSIRYGITLIDESSASDSIVNYNKANFSKTHTVTINGLIPATKYIFVTSSTDVSGNIGQSAESSFTTASPSSLTSIKAQSLNLGQATITWSTSSNTTSIVEYGLTSSYGEKKESNTQTKEHSLELTSLNQGVTYHYRVKGKDQNGKLYASSDQTFEPKSPPQITNVSVNDITEHEATVSFTTNVPTNATVIYVNVSKTEENGSQSNMEIATRHIIKLKNLSQGTTFKLGINVRDEQGTSSVQEAKDITTGKDQNPPKIDMVKTDLALTQNDKVQAIISWTTDEQSSSYIIYKEGRTGQEKEYKITDNLTNSHVGVITIFKPGTVYNFKVKSIDASGNLAVSNDFALLTPKKRENIIQIIIGNFSDIFGWAKF